MTSVTATRCRTAWEDVPLEGTAPRTGAWLALEQDIAWSARALTSAALTAPARAVIAATTDADISVILCRSRGGPAHPDRFWFAPPGAAHTRTGRLDDLAMHLDGGGRPDDAPGRELVDPVLLICVNGKRDQCCAIEGHALLRDLAARDNALAPQILECSHLGGHRFAPTALVLPRGDIHGRVSADDAAAIISAAATHRSYLPTLRGASSLPPALQAADVALRRHLGDVDATWEFQPLDAPDCYRATTGAGQWRVRVTRSDMGISLAESCGGAAVDVRTWHVEIDALT
jgi:hypothetical protein